MGAARVLSYRRVLPRLVAELRDALDTCAERQRQLEDSLRVSRRLLRAWEPAETPTPEPTPGPEANEEAPSPACTPSPQDLKELELLTQALQKAVHVRKGISKAGERDKASSLKSGSIATSATTAAAPRWASQTKLPRATHQATRPAKGLPKPRLLSAADQTCTGRGPLAAKPGPDLRNPQIAPSAAPQAPKAFTLKEKGTLLQLPMAFRKAASQNSCLWAQLSSTQTSDSTDATTSSKTQFLQKMQVTSGWPSSGLSAAEVEAEVGRLQKACLLLRLRMEEELTRDPTDWMQEYRGLLTLEGLQAIVGQCLHRLRELQRRVAKRCLAVTPGGHIPPSSQKWWNRSWGRGLRRGSPWPHCLVEEEQIPPGAPSCFSTPAPRSCRLWQPSGFGWTCWTSKST
ncbi:uncharacterized protein C16orf59 homolog isoform X4 [Myotis lucifugus]|uniref:uncharacterized protein C16orf59 homolog isoform X4 n=1 Tax=Myotis lucifugus TaxID=59463 RepID=UPI000CCC84A3|nr:uncharacterized protein C16orf59 homolog isoform X4 [Myotis lucifugus]